MGREVTSFEGVLGGAGRGAVESDPVPGREPVEPGGVAYGVAAAVNAPVPDPGEEFPYVDTQPFDVPGRPGATRCSRVRPRTDRVQPSAAAFGRIRPGSARAAARRHPRGPSGVSADAR
jgi:hypothetical protein